LGTAILLIKKTHGFNCMKFWIFVLCFLFFSGCVPKSSKKETIYSFKTESFNGLGTEIEKDDSKLLKLFGLPRTFYFWEEDDSLRLKKENSKGWLGIAMRLAKSPIIALNGNDISTGIEVVSAISHSPGELAGFQMGDVIIGVDGKRFGNKKESSLVTDFRSQIESILPGESVKFEILRSGRFEFLKAILKERPKATPEVREHRNFEKLRSSFDGSLLNYILKKEHLEGRYKEVAEEIRQTASKVYNPSLKLETYNPFRLSEINFLAHYPLELPWVSRALTSSLENNFSSENQNISEMILEGMRALDLKFSESIFQKTESKKDLADYLEKLIEAIRVAKKDRLLALKGVDGAEVDRLVVGIGELLLANMEEDKAEPTLDEKILSQKGLLQFLEVANKIDLEALITSIYQVAQALDLEALIKLKNSTVNLNRFGDDWIVKEEEGITVIETSIGKVFIGGVGDNIYENDAAIIIDLGGNDKYLNRAGGNSLGIPFSVVIDFSGNDVYLSQDNWSQGAGLLGGGFLIDLSGDDTYSAPHFSQGAGFWGVGVLVDQEGSDVYKSQTLSQGAASFGIGLLAEGNGEDRYIAAQFAQGFGFVKGFGAIVERGGADHYFAGGVYPDFRDPKKSYVSLSQGFGFGARPGEFFVGASGGIGLLADASGNDVYVGDYFSQGSSYWFALGALVDGGGHDKYISGRYSQGAGIHLSYGILIDSEGDDQYLAYLGVSQGCGHDYGVGMLLDDGGSDQYLGGVISQGAGNDNGMGILNDNGGDDYYHIKDFGQGRGNFHKQRKKGSFGIHFDTGGGSDFYSPGYKNESLIYKTEWGIFADTN
jgi:hypothetical protein